MLRLITIRDLATDRQRLLLYNDKCPMCADLASKAEHFSHGGLSLLPLSSPEATRMLDESYGRRRPESYFLIMKDNRRTSIRHGWQAALSLARLVGTTGSLKLLGTYLNYRGRPLVEAEKKSCCREKAGIVQEDRRKFMKTVFSGSLVLVASAVGLSSPSFLRPQKSVQPSGEENGGGGWQILDPVALQKLLEEAKSSVDYNKVTDPLIARNLTVQPQVAQGFVRMAAELNPVYMVVIPFGQPGFYTGYVMYRRQANETFAASYVRHVNVSDPSGFLFLSASENGASAPLPQVRSDLPCIPCCNNQCTCCPVTTVCCCFTGIDPTTGWEYCYNEVFYPCTVNANGQPCGSLCNYQYCDQYPCGGNCCPCS